MIDYGLARKYFLSQSHISMQSKCPKAGNSTFASLNCHMGTRQSRRDDLESFAYMMFYLMRGKLPWQSRKFQNSLSK